MNIKNEVAKLLASDGGEYYGYSVSISGDGNTVIVGVPYSDGEKGIDVGSAYIYTRTNGTWVKQSKLVASDGAAGDWFGWSVAISGDGNTVIVGARNNDSNKGSAYIYTRTNDTWTQQSKLLAGDGAGGDYFGQSVSISSDGNTVIVGAYNDDNENGDSAGSVYVYSRNDNEWVEETKLIASDVGGFNRFGSSLAISGDGNTVVVGVHADDNYRGSVHIYTRSGSTWAQQSKLVASDGVAYDFFGLSIAISGDGNNVIVGVPYDSNEKGISAGSAYIFTRTNGEWTEQVKLLASGGNSGDSFGHSVDISHDGNTAIVGAIGGDGYRGTAYIFTRTGFIDIPKHWQSSTASLPEVTYNMKSIPPYDNIISEIQNIHIPLAMILGGSTWNEQAKLVASGGIIGDNFGISVSITSDGNTAIVGAHGNDNKNGVNAGSAYVFDLT